MKEIHEDEVIAVQKTNFNAAHKKQEIKVLAYAAQQHTKNLS